MPNDSNNKVNITLNSPTTNQINEFMFFFHSFLLSLSLHSMANDAMRKKLFRSIILSPSMKRWEEVSHFKCLEGSLIFYSSFSPVLFAPDDFIVSFHMPQRRRCDAYVLGGVVAFANKLSFSRPPFHVIFLTALCNSWQHFFFCAPPEAFVLFWIF